MAANWKWSNETAVGDLATTILDPLLRKRAGMSIALLSSWDEIVGERLAQVSRPEKIAWPRRLREDDPFEPATLVIACEGAAALRIQHESGQIIERTNAFLGFGAIGRIRIQQKPVAERKPERPQPKPLDAEQARRLEGLVAGIEDDGLRHALERLGRAVMARRG